MAEARFNVRGLDSIQRSFDEMRGVLAHNLDVALRDSASKWERQVKRQQFAGAAGAGDGSSTYSDKLRSRTGALRSSLVHYATGSGLRRKRFLVSQGVDYATIQQFGGKIRGNPWLLVPLPIAFRPSGTRDPRFIAKQVGGRWQYPDGRPSFIVRSKKGNLLTGFSQGGQFTPTHVLKREVTIPGPETGKPSRFRFFETWFEDLRGDRRRRLARALKATRNGRRL